MIAPDLAGLAVPVDELQLLDGNPRRGDVDAVARSLERFGQRKPIVVRRSDRQVLAGNHTLQAARKLGWPDIAVVWVDDDEAMARAFALADNRTAELGGYDDEALAEMVAAVHGADPELLAATGWSAADVAQLLGSAEELPPALTDPDEVPEPPAEPVSKPGDAWILGPHRLMCGDATNPDHLTKVTDGLGEPGIVYTDPPYGISAVPKDGGVSRGKLAVAQKFAPVAGDDTTDVARDAFRLLYATYPDAWQVWWGGNHYAASAGLPDASCWLIWDKENGGSDFADAELAWTNHPGAVRLFRHMWNGMLRASERTKRVHPTQKPVALAEWAFSVIDPKNERRVVLDVFGGSGSTLIAAHQTGRAAAAIEMEPAYIDVICRRYQEHTGTLPVLAATGEPHDFTGGADGSTDRAAS